MKRKNIIIFVLAILLPIFLIIAYLWQSRQILTFYVKNNLSANISSVKISLLEEDNQVSKYFYSISPQEEKTFIWNVTNKVKSDGGYLIEVFQEDDLVFSKNFGYFTNGGHLDKNYYIEINNDKIEIEINKK